MVITDGGSGVWSYNCTVRCSSRPIRSCNPQSSSRHSRTRQLLSTKLIVNKTQVLTISADVAKKEQIDKAFAQTSANIGGKLLNVLNSNGGCFPEVGARE